MEDDHVIHSECTGDNEVSTSFIPSVATSPMNHHPRKLPNIPRNPEIYEPSPGIFKYIRKDNRTAVTSNGEGGHAATASSKENHHESLANSKTKCDTVSPDSDDSEPKKRSSVKMESEEMSVELECYDEATHNTFMSQQAEHVEPAQTVNSSPGRGTNSPRLGGNPPRLASDPSKPASSSPSSNYKRPNLSYKPPNLKYKPPNLSYGPPKLDNDRGPSVTSKPKCTPLPITSDVPEIQPYLPADSDTFDTLRSKLNRAMHLYTIQRRQMIKLSARVKNLTRTNERLAERARSANTGVNRPSPCLATDTKYLLLFENLISPEAMSTITTAMATSEKP